MLLDSIRTHLDSLSKSERKVALAVLKNPDLAVAENITALAKSAQVSEPTVVRFCRTIGYDGPLSLELFNPERSSPHGLSQRRAVRLQALELPQQLPPIPVHR